ncbi:glutathione S-transferase D5-like [Anopheles ziemanni]|uniref:glutathione S-transferase D5-like n=1 Tax=Anopheles coustani TaxID=139045 RepID=UPI00265B3F75|nr:glutathione S-transferase D5-like [Anopheles coustani]XP_058169867.1 glutathione S-transferase D5-like [Anopheles ziemanni]
MELYSHIISPPCQNVLLVAKKLGVTLNIKETNVEDPVEVAALTKINPQHTIPTFVDEGHVIWESYAIAIYLVEKYGKDDALYPKDAKVRSVVNQRLFFDIGTLYKSVLANIDAVLEGKQPSEELKEKLKKALDLTEKFVTERAFVAADHLTIADIFVLGSVTALGWVKYGLEAYPGIQSWVAKVTAEFPDYAEFHKELTEGTEAYIAANAAKSN